MKFFISVSLIFSCFAALDACTGIRLMAKDGSFIHGRTVEFGIPIATSIAVVPRGYQFEGTTPNGKGLSYKAKYGVLGAITYDEDAITDGINEKGLSAGTFYFPGFAVYAKITRENQGKALAPTEFSNWILTQFATIDEVKAALPDVVIAPTIIKEWGNATPPYHYIVYDSSGKCLVIEPIDGKLVAYDNPFGSFTNSPSFDWQMTNLRNFINLRKENVKPIVIDGETLAPFGQGSGMVGLPGDFTSPSRFVRATLFSTLAIPASDAEKAIFQAFHILNQFDIPVGIACETAGKEVHCDYTMVTCVRDPQALKYYYKSYEDQLIKVVDLNKFDLDGKTILKVGTFGKDQAIDVSAELRID